MAEKPKGKFKKSGGGGGGLVGFGEQAIIGVGLVGLIIFVFYPALQGKVDPNLLSGATFRSWGELLLHIWQSRLAPFVIVLNVGLLIVGIAVVVRAWPLYPHLQLFEIPSVIKGKRRIRKNPVILKHWANIVRRANTGTPENLRLAVLEADALVDYFLRYAGYQGEHMADRLSQILPGEVKSLERLWASHRLRNDLAHTPGYRISGAEAKEALIAFRDFLKELEAF